MTDGEMGFSAAGQAWMAWPTDVGQAAVAIIAKTRHEWASRWNAPSSPDEADVDRTRFAHAQFAAVTSGIADAGSKSNRANSEANKDSNDSSEASKGTKRKAA